MVKELVLRGHEQSLTVGSRQVAPVSGRRALVESTGQQRGPTPRIETRQILGPHFGLAVLDDGTVRRIPPLAITTRGR